MHHISHIHSTEFIFRPFCHFQAILQKMCKCTGRKPLQPGSTVWRNFPVKNPCHSFSDHIRWTFRKRYFCQPFHKCPIFRTLKVPAVQFLEHCIIPIRFSRKTFQQIIQTDSRKFQKLHGVLHFSTLPDFHFRKHFPDIINKKGRA